MSESEGDAAILKQIQANTTAANATDAHEPAAHHPAVAKVHNPANVPDEAVIPDGYRRTRRDRDQFGAHRQATDYRGRKL